MRPSLSDRIEKAVVATGRKMLCTAWHILVKNEPYHEAALEERDKKQGKKIRGDGKGCSSLPGTLSPFLPFEPIRGVHVSSSKYQLRSASLVLQVDSHHLPELKANSEGLGCQIICFIN
jgi:hypothetical protein